MDRPYRHETSVLQTLAQRRSFLARIDPRLRIACVVALACFVAFARQPVSLAITAALAVLLWVLSGLSVGTVIKRLLPLNIVMLILALFLSMGADGHALASIGPIRFSQQGLQLAGTIALKGNIILLVMLSMLGPMEPATLGHALVHLGMPKQLVHLLLLTIRYLDVLHRELQRMRTAMKARAFQPRLNLHTYRSYGYLIGMLLVRSLERAERVSAAMKCRGFAGQFYLLEHFAFSWIDMVFVAAALLATAALVAAEWL